MEKLFITDTPKRGTKCAMCNKDIKVGDTINIDVVEAANQYDTLKAKAELFDELIEWLDHEDCKPFVLGEITRELVNLVVMLTDKAKELK